MFWLWRKLRGKDTTDFGILSIYIELTIWAVIVVTVFLIALPFGPERKNEKAWQYRDLYLDIMPFASQEIDTELNLCTERSCGIIYANDGIPNEICNSFDGEFLCSYIDKSSEIRTFDIAVKDLNSDVYDDLILAHQYSIEACYHTGAIGFHFDCDMENRFSTGKQANVAVLVGDLNQDNVNEIILLHPNSVRICHLFVPSFECAEPYLTEGKNWNAKLSDLSGDGFLDIVVANVNDSKICHYTSASPSLLECNSFDKPVEAFDIAIGDIDGDSDLDIVVSEFLLKYCLNHNGVFSECKIVPGLPDGGHYKYAKIPPRDIDEDGIKDNGMYGSASIALGDLDNDGDLDLVTGGAGLFAYPNGHIQLSMHQHEIPKMVKFAPHVCFYKGNNFECKLLDDLGYSVNKVTLADIDNDHDLDVLFANRNALWTSNLTEMQQEFSHSDDREFTATNRICENRHSNYSKETWLHCKPISDRNHDTWSVSIYPNNIESPQRF